ncbi:MAG: DUF481 domain-containing protein, partial [Halomonas subglaciescola]|nr:DUF481 domain-containing protein [Halomonas subglaciescola]
MQRRPQLAPFSLLPLFFLSPLLSADTLWLENGDRVTGEVVDKTSARWRVETDYAGDIEIDTAKVARVAIDKPPSPSVNAVNALSFVTQLKPVPKPEPSEDDPLTTFAERPFSASGGVDMAFEYEHSNADTKELEFDARQRIEVGHWRHKWRARYHREYRNGKRRKNDWHMSYSPERFFSEQRFWQG